MSKFAFSFTLTILLLTSCSYLNTNANRAHQNGTDAPAATLTIFTAASLVEPFTELSEIFKIQNPNVRIIFNFAGSQQLAHQIAQGAPGDVFVSADTNQMDIVVQTGRINPQSPQIFTYNRLVVIFPAENPAGIQVLQDLSKPGLKFILADEAVPAGNYALQFLAKVSQTPEFDPHYEQTVLANIVSYEANVKAVLSKVLLGEADAGIVYTSDITDYNANQLGSIQIPQELNILADYVIAPLEDTQQQDLANNFIAFILSPEGQQTLRKHGFITVK